MNKPLIILPFLLFTLLSNSTFATNSYHNKHQAKDLIELISGENIVTGKPLSTADKVLAAVGVVSLGTSKYLTKGGKYTLKLFNSTPLKKATSKVSKWVKNNILKKFDDWKKVNTGINRVYRSARKLGLKAKEEIAGFADFTRRALGNEVGAIGDIGKLVDKAKGASREIITLKTQLQKKFKHAKDFGINGNANKQTLNQFSDAITNHVKAPTTKVIEGTYHQTQKVIHYVDPSTGLNVMKDYQGKFISTWKLSPEQLRNVLERGSL
jgi:hypothetical protein